MRNGFSLRSKRLNVGAARQNLDAREQYIAEDDNLDGSSVASMPFPRKKGEEEGQEFMVGIKDDEDEGVETELRHGIFMRKHVIVHHETDATKSERRKHSCLLRDDVMTRTSSRPNKGEEPMAGRDDKVLKTELAMGDEDDGVETKLNTKNDVRKHGSVVSPDVVYNSDENVIIKSEDETREVETSYNRDDLSLQSLKKNKAHSVNETSRAFVAPAVDKRGHSAIMPPPTKVEEEQRDDFCADKEEERHPVVPDKEEDSTDGSLWNNAAGFVSDGRSVEAFPNHEESIQANNHSSSMMDIVTTAGGVFWEEDGTTPIDFVKAIISGEVWSDIFDDEKNPRSASGVSDQDDALNQFLNSISDFIQGDESKRAYFESLAQLDTARMSRREQAKSMNAALAQEIQALSIPQPVPPEESTNNAPDSNQSKQKATKKSGIIALLKNRVAGQSSRKVIAPSTTRRKGSPVKSQPSDRQSPAQDENKVVYDSTKLPWIEKETTTLSPTTSFLLTTREETSGDKKNDEENVDDGDDVKKCFRLVEECWTEISRLLLLYVHGGNYEEPSQSEGQTESSMPRTTPIERSPSPTRTKSRGGLGAKAGGKAVATSRSTTPRATSPSRRGGQKRSRSQPATARGRSLSRIHAQRQRGGQRSKTMSPTRTGKHTSSKVMSGKKSSKRHVGVRNRETKRKSHYQRRNKSRLSK